MLSKILKIMTSLTQMRKIKHCKLAKLSLQEKKNSVRICQSGPDRFYFDANPIRSASTWKFGSGSASKRCQSTILEYGTCLLLFIPRIVYHCEKIFCTKLEILNTFYFVRNLIKKFSLCVKVNKFSILLALNNLLVLFHMRDLYDHIHCKLMVN
jgi:hypothetical protein